MGRIIVRWCALLLGVTVIWTGVHLAREPYREVVEFRHAEECPRGVPESGCIGRETGRVTDKGTTTFTTGSGHDASTDTDYWLHIERGSGDVEKLKVSLELYNTAQPGSRAALEVWHGEVVAITTGGVRDALMPSSAGLLLVALLMAWVGAGLVLWCLLGDGRFGERSARRAFGWLFLGAWTLGLGCGMAVFIQDPKWGEWVGMSLLWLPGAVLTMLFMSADDPFDRYADWRRRRSVQRWQRKHERARP